VAGSTLLWSGEGAFPGVLAEAATTPPNAAEDPLRAAMRSLNESLGPLLLLLLASSLGAPSMLPGERRWPSLLELAPPWGALRDFGVGVASNAAGGSAARRRHGDFAAGGQGSSTSCVWSFAGGGVLAAVRLPVCRVVMQGNTTSFGETSGAAARCRGARLC